MRADDDGAARLERDQDLVDRRGRRIGGRHDRGDDAEGLGDLDDLPLVVPADDADRTHRPDELVHALGREQVLLDLVGDDAVSGLFDRQAGELFGARPGRGRHRVDDAIDLILGELGEERRRLLGALREPARFLNGSEVAVSLGGSGGGHSF
jgi:hypothetical protein